MVIDNNNIPPITVNDSIRIAKGIAYTGFPIAGLLGAAMFAFFPMPYPIIIGLVAIGGVFIAFIAALTKERDEFHKINRSHAIQAARTNRKQAEHELRMKEIGYAASLRVWEAQQMVQLGLPAPSGNPVAPGPDRVFVDYQAQPQLPEAEGEDEDTEERDSDGLILPKFVRESSKRMIRENENTLERTERLAKLAKHVRNFCLDRNPSQENILERIPMMPNSLLCSHEHITQALDLLAIPLVGRSFGWVTPRGKRGSPRLWIDQQTGQPIKK